MYFKYEEKVYLLLFLDAVQGTQQTLEDPEKPWIFFAPGKIPWKTLKLQPTSEKSCSEADFPRINCWPCSAVTSFYPCNAGEEDHTISSKAQNERWMGTDRRSICDNHIFPRKQNQKCPGKPLKFNRKSPGKPWKRISFHCWPPCVMVFAPDNFMSENILL